AALLWRTSVPGDLNLANLDPREFFSARHLERSETYQRGPRLLWIGATLVQLVVLVLAVRFAPRTRWRGIPGGVALGALTLVAVWLAGLPFVLAAHWWRRRYGISRSDYSTILVDPWLGGGGSLAAACLAIALVMLLARRLGDRWWIVGGPAFAALVSAFILVQPLLRVPPPPPPPLLSSLPSRCCSCRVSSPCETGSSQPRSVSWPVNRAWATWTSRSR